jgi:hypothetical protein
MYLKEGVKFLKTTESFMERESGSFYLNKESSFYNRDSNGFDFMDKCDYDDTDDYENSNEENKQILNGKQELTTGLVDYCLILG